MGERPGGSMSVLKPLAADALFGCWLTEVETGAAKGENHNTAENLFIRTILSAAYLPRSSHVSSSGSSIMTHHKLGVALRLALQLLLLMLLEAASGGGKKTPGSDAGSHCVGSVGGSFVGGCGAWSGIVRFGEQAWGEVRWTLGYDFRRGHGGHAIGQCWGRRCHVILTGVSSYDVRGAVT